MRQPIFSVSLANLHKLAPEEFIGRREHYSEQPAVAHEVDNELSEIDFMRREHTTRTKDGPIHEYLIHWKGWDVEYDTWEAASDLQAEDTLVCISLKEKHTRPEKGLQEDEHSSETKRETPLDL